MTDLDPTIRDVLALWPDDARKNTLQIRDWLFAKSVSLSIQRLDESLKWGQPAWRPSRGGSTIRIWWTEKSPDQLGLFVHCQTDLLERLKLSHPNAFAYQPPRAAYLTLDDPLPRDAIETLAEMAFRYRRVLPSRHTS